MDAMKSSQDEIALQGIEFWSNVCDEEYELQLLQQEVKRREWRKRFHRLFVVRLKNKVVNLSERVATTLGVLCRIWFRFYFNA